jgi:hypothetical protein
MTDDEIIQAGEYGADAGWPAFTYTQDAAGFYRDNAELIDELLQSDAEDFGYDNVAAFVGSFKRAVMTGTVDGFANLLAWYALETAGRFLSDRDEITAD